MSNPPENIPQTSSENPKLTLKEMRIDYQSPSLHSEIARILKHMVTQSISQMMVTPEVQMVEPTTDKVAAHIPVANKAGRRKAEITTSTTVGEISFSFQLPVDCIINKIDMDKVYLSYLNFTQPHVEGKVNLTQQFSFRERLQGWNIERRQRENGTYDVFYRHSKSRKMFRFITEVVNFLQYEVYCDNYKNKVKLEEDLVKHISEDASVVKRKRKSTSSNGRKRHEAFSSEDNSNYEELQNVATENELKTTYSNISNKTKMVMEEAFDIEESRKRKTTKGQDFLIAADENAAKTETTQTVDETLIKEGKRTVEFQGDGSLEEVIEILKNAKLEQKEVKHEFPDLHDIPMDWSENDALLEAYFDECELIDHIPICETIDELIESLITIRNEKQE